MSLTSLLDTVGDWNPQLFREWRGKLTPRNIIVTVFISLVIQYFIYQVTREMSYRILDYILPRLLIIVGAYGISHDLAKEYSNRTLEFIRLSPQSSQKILLGKILGVPILLYLGIGLALPFHGISAVWDNSLSLGRIVGTYLFWLAQAGLFYTFSLLCTFYTLSLNQQQKSSPAMVGGSIALITYIFSFLDINFFQRFVFEEVGLTWYGLQLHQSYFLFVCWLILIMLAIAYLFWRMANRHLQNPQGTFLSKAQSYHITLFSHLWFLGFSATFSPTFVMIFLFSLIPLGTLLLLSGLCPSRQALLDWTRYRHFNKTGLWQDLIWGEKSPPILTMGINILIPLGIWMSWLIFSADPQWIKGNVTVSRGIIGVIWLFFLALSTLGMTLIYVTLTQIITLAKHNKDKTVWGSLLFVCLLTVLPIILGISLMANSHHTIPLLWLFTPLPIFILHKGSITAMIIGVMLQFSLLGILFKQLKHHFALAGASSRVI